MMEGFLSSAAALALTSAAAILVWQPACAGAYASSPQPVQIYHPPSHQNAAPVPDARYSIGNQYYGKADLKEILAGDPASSPFIDAANALSRKGTGLMVGGLVLMPLFILGGTVLTISGYLRDLPIDAAIPAGVGLLVVGIGIGIPLVAVGGGKKRKAGREFNKGINAYNAAHPDSPVVIEQDYGFTLSAVPLPSGAGLVLRAAF